MIDKEYRNKPEYVKSGYLYRLAGFVEWPHTSFNFSMSPFMIGLFGNDEIDVALFDTLRDRRIKERDWKVEHYTRPEEIRHCHLLFISEIQTEILSQLIFALSHKKVLTVGDNIDGFCQKGGIINLNGSHPNYGYEINLHALKQAGLTIDKEFLDLATIID